MMKYYYPIHWLVIIILGLAIYAQTFGYNFQFDDWEFIVNNQCITSFDRIHYIWKFYPPTRTIGFCSFALNYYFNQLDPHGYHIFNFIIHLIATGLVWALASLLFKIVGWKRTEFPFMIALLFLVHPGQTQAVTYISQRFESMATVFYLGSIFAYLQARVRPLRAHQILFFVISAICAVLGILTKEVAVTIPLMILAIEFIFFKGHYRRIILMGGGLIFLMVFIRLVRTNFNIFIHFTTPSLSHDGDIITAQNYFLTQMRVFLTFIRLLILPIHQNLDYDYPVSTSLIHPPLTLLGILVIGGMMCGVVRLRQQFPLIAFGLAWILITFSVNLAPRANVIFEHKLYLISFGFFLALVGTLFILIRSKKIVMGLCITMIAIFLVLSFIRNQIWKDDLTLWTDISKESPHKAKPFYNLGFAYYKLGNSEEAIQNFDKAIQFDRDYISAYINRGITYDAEGNYKQALLDFTQAMEINPKIIEAYYNRGNTYLKQNNFNQAILDYTKAIDINPNDISSYNNRAAAYFLEKNYAQAILNYDKILSINPSNAEAYNNRAMAYRRLNQTASKN